MSTYDTYAARMDPTPRVYKRSGPFGTEALKSVAAAMEFCEREGLDPAEVSLAHNYVIWESTETPDEVAARIARSVSARAIRAETDRASHVARIREIYDEYAELGLYEDGA
jgi:hypothetical protein